MSNTVTDAKVPPSHQKGILGLWRSTAYALVLLIAGGYPAFCSIKVPALGLKVNSHAPRTPLVCHSIVVAVSIRTG